MSWIAIAGAGTPGWVCPKALGGNAGPRTRLMARGSILIETRMSPGGRPQTLLAFNRAHPWPGAISLQAIPGGSIALILAQGADVFHTVLDHGHSERTDVIRVTFSWDAPARWGRLTVERPESDVMVSLDTPAPPPIMLCDVETMARHPQLCQRDDDVVFFAVSDRIEPIGPAATLSAPSPVETPRGWRRLGDLKCGDLICTRDAGIVPVLERVSRVVPGLGSFQPVRLRAPYFGLRQDIVVAPDQRMVISGSEVEYMFGQEAVLVSARHLVNGTAARWEEAPRLIRYTQLLLPGHEALIVAGTALESLYIGRLRRKPPNCAATLLKDTPANFLPEHRRSGYPVLRAFEAVTLAQARAA